MSERYILTWDDILRCMEKAARGEKDKEAEEGRRQLAIWRNYMETILKLEMPSDREVIEYFKQVTGAGAVLSLKKRRTALVKLGLKLLGFRPDYEPATHWGAYWVNALFIERALQKGHTVQDLYGDLADRRNFIGMDPQTVFISALGHGNETTFGGQYGEKVLWVGYEEGAQVMAGKAGSFLSCLIGRELLPWLVEKGMAAARGYNEVYYFVVERNNWPDGHAKWFFQAHFRFEDYILNGHTWKDAYEESRQTYMEYVNADYVPSECKPYLLHDCNAMVMFGDEDWKLPGQPPPPPPSKWCPSEVEIVLIVHSCVPTQIQMERKQYEAWPSETMYMKGRITNTMTGDPVIGAKLYLYYPAEDKVLATAESNENGEFEFAYKVDLPPNEEGYRLKVRFLGEAMP